LVNAGTQSASEPNISHTSTKNIGNNQSLLVFYCGYTKNFQFPEPHFSDEEAHLAHEEAEFESRIQFIREIKASNPIGCVLQEDEQQKVGNPVEPEEEEEEEGEEGEQEGDDRGEIQDSFGVDVSDQVNQTFEREDEPLVMIDSEEVKHNTGTAESRFRKLKRIWIFRWKSELE
jgi:hypothetical protein